MATTFLKWISRALDLIYPRNCQFCTKPLEEEQRGVILVLIGLASLKIR